MKNFKKVLALVLVVATLLSFATVAGAVDTTSIYADADSVKYVEAVDVLTAIGVLNGKGASYKPNDTLKRSEAAKIIAMFDNGDTEISSLYNPANSFVDVADNYWAISYIAYCAKQGIISGVGNSKFAPESKLTGIQFLKMVLVTLGYDAKEEGFTGTSWKANVLKLALSTGLTDVLGKKYDYEAELTRDAAAQIMLNALNAKTVSYGQEVKNSGKKTVLTVAGAVENDGYLYESWDLTKKESITDAFGRPAHSWKLGKEEIGTYTDAALASYTVAVSHCDVIDDADLEEGDKLAVYDNSKTAEFTKLTLKNTTDADIGGQGILTEVYEDRIVFINTYLGQVKKVTSEKTDAKGHVTRKAETTVDVYMGNNATQFSSAGDANTLKYETESFAKDDMVIVTVADDAIQSVELADSKIASFDKVKTVDDVYSMIALDGEYVDIANDYYYDGIDTDDLGSDMVAYFDAYGNLIGMEKYYAALNYAVIDALYVETVKGRATLRADLVTVTGEEIDDVEVNTIRFAMPTVGGGTANTAYDVDDVIKSGWDHKDYVNDSDVVETFYNKLMAYTTDDGVYTLTVDYTNESGKYGDIVDVASATFDGSKYFDADSTTVQMSDETLVLVSTEGAPDGEYTAYTGYENLPSMVGKAQYHMDEDAKKADIVYVYDIEISGTETVVFFAGEDRVGGAKKDGKYPIDFEAYVVNEDGSVNTTATTYTYKADSDYNALNSAPNGFYTIYVGDDNVVTFKNVSAGKNVTVADATTAANNAVKDTDTAADLITVDSVTLKDAAKTTVYNLDGSALKTDVAFEDIEDGDYLYVYRNDDGLFTVVDAAAAADVVVQDSGGNVVTGVSVTLGDPQILGHKWSGTTITLKNADEYKITKVTVNSHDFTQATGNAGWESENTSLTVSGDIVVEVALRSEWISTDIDNDEISHGSVSGTVITLNAAYTVEVLQAELDAAVEDGATVAIYSSVNVLAESDATVTDAFFVVVTAADGETTATYTIA